MKIISDKSINYPFAAVVWIVVSMIFYILFRYVNLDGKFWILLSFLSGAIIAFADRDKVAILTVGLLQFNGEEVKDENGNSVYLDPGWYFTFFFFSINKKESQKMEKRDVVIPAFNCQDKSRLGLTAEANGDWVIADDGHDKFKEQDESKMESNLSSLVRRSIIRVFATLDFETEIKGKDLGDKIQNHDPVFERECSKYGIIFHNLIVDAIPSDMRQENLNSYSKRLFEEEKAKYPVGYKFTHQELRDIEETIQIKLGQARKIISNSPLLGRFDVKD
jgi:hypothetical protein